MAVTISSGLPQNVNLIAYHGDTWSQQFQFVESGVPLDLTSATITAEARGTNGLELQLPTGIVGAATNGTISIGLPATGVLIDLYDYDIQIVKAGNTVTWVNGRLQVRPDVTG
jgi:hypothetical protein